MAARKKRRKKTGRKKRKGRKKKTRRTKGHVPLNILERRLSKLNRTVTSRGGKSFPGKPF